MPYTLENYLSRSGLENVFFKNRKDGGDNVPTPLVFLSNYVSRVYRLKHFGNTAAVAVKFDTRCAP